MKPDSNSNPQASTNPEQEGEKPSLFKNLGKHWHRKFLALGISTLFGWATGQIWILYLPLAAISIGIFWEGHLLIQAKIAKDSGVLPSPTPIKSTETATDFLVKRIASSIPENNATLIPGNENISYPDGISSDAAQRFFFFAFGDAYAWTQSLPFTAIRQNGEDIIDFTPSDSGVNFSAKFFNKEGKILCEIRDNTFTINYNHVFRIDRPSPNRLIVFDDEAREVININFAKRNFITMVGDFYARDGVHIILKPNGIQIDKRRISGLTIGQCEIGIDL